MKVHIIHEPGAVLVRARLEGAGALGDYLEEVQPGEHWGAWPYEQLRALPAGEADLDPAAPPNST